MTTSFSGDFWSALDRLVSTCPVRIDRPKGSHHPRYPEFVYPLDYGYLEGTSSMDGGGIDVWMGDSKNKTLGALIATVDLIKRDAEIKILLGCTEEETQAILKFHNGSSMRALLVRR